MIAATCAHARPVAFTVPALTGPVVDDANLLSPRARDLVEDYLRGLREAGGTQVTVVTVPSIGDLSIEDASIRIADAWQLGRAKVDDGVLMVIAAEQHRIRIEVGRGREGVLPDVTASRIVREIMIPRMREVGADRAVADGVRAVVGVTDPEFARDHAIGARGRHPAHGRMEMIHLLIWILLLLLFVGGNRFFGAGVVTGGLMRGPLGGWGGSDGNSNDSWSGGGGGFSGGGASGEW